MTLFEILPSLRNACEPRFDPKIWPSGTGFRGGRLVVGALCVEDLADCDGTPTRLGEIVVTRVKSVVAGIVHLDAAVTQIRGADIANRHSVQGRQYFAVGDTKIELPTDVRAGDVLAIVLESEAPVLGEP